MVDREEWTGDVSDWVQELLAVSQRAWDCAAIRDFTRLAQSIEERNRLIKAFPSLGDIKSMPIEVRRKVSEILTSAKKIDSEIQNVLMHEMEQDQRAIRDTAHKAKALTAYDRTLPKHRRFDRSK